MSLSSFGLGQANNPVYVSTTRVRAEAGFTGNTNVTDTSIDVYISQAHAIVQSFIAASYDITKFTSANADFVGSHAEGYVERAEELIAAGYLLMKEFGTDDFDAGKKEGKQKVREGEALMARLSDADNPIHLLDINGNEFTRIAKQTAGTFAAGGAVEGENIFSVSMKW